MAHQVTGLSTDDASFWAVIPAGGSGTRLWPLSRANRPKFLLSLTGERSLLQQTVDRLGPLAPPSRTMVVCGPAHAGEIARQVADVPAEHILVEPSPKGSGPAIALAAALIAQRNPTAIMGSFAADHEVGDTTAFTAAARTAIAAARQGWLTTIGLSPTRPETGYGYLERTEEPVAGAPGAFRVRRFVEKPDLERARAYVESGHHLWNASMFVWRVDAFLAEVERLLPELYAGLLRITASWDSVEREATIAEVWASLPEITVDQGVMEHADNVAVVPAEMGWSDVGDWHGLGELMTQDDAGNGVRANFLHVEAQRCVVWSETGRLVSLLGVEGIVVVDTPDALLVAERGRAQQVRDIVKRLQERDHRLS